tara:strand:+ start:130 stop:1185 length:1056 start_codon:yes stop_codon:yes gene_type:complete
MAVQERKLQSRLFASLNRSDELVNFLLEKVGENFSCDDYVVDDHDPLNENDEIDFMLTYKNKTSKKTVSIGLEIKRPSGTLGIDQIERYLNGMRIKKKDSWRLQKKTKRIGKYLLIVTTDLSMPKPVSEIRKYSGFDTILFWVSWYEIIDWMNNQSSNRTFKQLIAELEKEGIRPSNSSIRLPSPYKTLKSRILDMQKVLESYKQTKSAIGNQLKNLEYQMKLHGFSLVNNPKRLNNRFDGTNIPMWHGRVFIKDRKQSYRAGSGIAFGYCHKREQWFVHVESTSNPDRDSQKIIRKLARIVDAPKNKKWVPTYKRNNNTDGGWNIDTNARTPAKLAKFMQSVWSSYQEIN